VKVYMATYISWHAINTRTQPAFKQDEVKTDPRERIL
jgi:hypothetical protein